MEDMSDFILSPYEGSASMDSEEADRVQPVIKVKEIFIFLFIILRLSGKPEKGAPDSRWSRIDGLDWCCLLHRGWFWCGRLWIEGIWLILKSDFKYFQKLHGVDMDLDELDRERMKLKSQLTVVSKKISVLIMERSPSYSSQLEDMTEIQNSIKQTLQHVFSIRK